MGVYVRVQRGSRSRPNCQPFPADPRGGPGGSAVTRQAHPTTGRSRRRRALTVTGLVLLPTLISLWFSPAHAASTCVDTDVNGSLDIAIGANESATLATNGTTYTLTG